MLLGHHKMISKGSCDTEVWSNGVIQLCHYRNILHFKIYSNRKKNIHNITVFLSHSALVSIKDFFQSTPVSTMTQY